MTREEAIERINQDLKVNSRYLKAEYKKALRLAIRSLEAWDEVKQEMETFKYNEHTYDYGGFDRSYDGIAKIIDKHLKEVEE